MRRRRTFRRSVVLTFAGSVAQSAGCGATTTGDGAAAETGGAIGDSGSMTNRGTGGFGGAAVACPAFQLYDACPPADRCLRELDCASGPTTLLMECEGADGWRTNESCDLPYDHCPTAGFSADCVDGQWRLLGAAGNPPAPCPADPPLVGASCRLGGFGGDREHCGYPCPSGEGWTVRSCVPVVDAGINGSFAWQSDDACNRD